MLLFKAQVLTTLLYTSEYSWVWLLGIKPLLLGHLTPPWQDSAPFMSCLSCISDSGKIAMAGSKPSPREMHAVGGDEWVPSTPRSLQSRPRREHNGALALVRLKVNGDTAFRGHRKTPYHYLWPHWSSRPTSCQSFNHAPYPYLLCAQT